MTTEGLSELERQRLGQRRTPAPPPRHPKPDVEVPPPPDEPLSPPLESVAPRPQPQVLTPLRPAQLYLDEETDEALRRCRAEGLLSRIDVTNSAVVRLAIRRLMEQLGPQGIVDQLAREPDDRHRTGRKRR